MFPSHNKNCRTSNDTISIRRKPFGNVENTRNNHNNNNNKGNFADVSYEQKKLSTTTTTKKQNKRAAGTNVQTLARNFAPSKLDTESHYKKHHKSNGKPSHPQTKIFPKSDYRVTIYKSPTSTSGTFAPVPARNSTFLPVAPRQTTTLPAAIRPNDKFLGRFKSVVASGYPFGTGYLDIRGAIQEGDPEWKGSLNLDDVEFTEAQVARVRVLIVPPERYSTMDEMGRLILGKQFECRNKVFGPGYSYHVLRSYKLFKKRYANVMGIKIRFNLLFGYTYHLYQNDWWMTHHGRGWGGEKMIAGLAFRWKDLLTNSPEHIGLDIEFSYPAVVHFLKEFQEKVEKVEMYGDPPMKFAFC